jgi:hypothetical protein
MSTKIWEAYRLKKDYDLWEVTTDLRHRAERNIKRSLAKLYQALVEDAKKQPKDRVWFPHEQDLSNFSIMRAHDHVLKAYRANFGLRERDTFDFDVSITIRRTLRGKRYLLIPYPGSSGITGNALHFMRKHEALEDYHFQDQSDQPDNISSREWHERGRTWAPLLEDSRWRDIFLIEVLSVSNFWTVSPAYDMMLKSMNRKAK